MSGLGSPPLGASPRSRRTPLDAMEADSLRSASGTQLQSLLATGQTMTKRHNAWLHMSRLEQRLEGLDQDTESLGREQRHADYRDKLAAEARIEGIEDQAARDAKSAEARCGAKLKQAEDRRASEAAAFRAQIAAAELQHAADLDAQEARRTAELAMAHTAGHVAQRVQQRVRAQLRAEHGATVATLQEECAATLARARAEHRKEIDSSSKRMVAQAAMLRDELDTQADNHESENEAREKSEEVREAENQADFREKMAALAAANCVHLVIMEEQAFIDSEQLELVLEDKLAEWEEKCDEATRLTDELAASVASRVALVKEGQLLSEKVDLAESTLGEEVARLEGLLKAEQVGRAAETTRWDLKVRELIGQAERSVLIASDVQQKSDTKRLENAALELALSSKAQEAGALSDDLAATQQDRAALSEAAQLLSATGAAAETFFQGQWQELNAELGRARAQNERLLVENQSLQRSVDANGSVMASACDAVEVMRAELSLTSNHSLIMCKLADRLGKGSEGLAKRAFREWRRVQTTHRRAVDAARRLSTGLLGMVWRAWHRTATDAESQRIRQQIAAAERTVREEFGRREKEVYEGAQTLVSATQAHYEAEISMLQKKLQIAALSPGSPSARMILEPEGVAGSGSPTSLPRVNMETPRIGSGGGGGGSLSISAAVEMSADPSASDGELSDSDSDADEVFHDATPITRELDEMLSDESAIGQSLSQSLHTTMSPGSSRAFDEMAASSEEFDHLRRLLARRSGENARLSTEIERLKQSGKDGTAWANELESEVEQRMTAEAETAVAVARVDQLLQENKSLQSAEQVAIHAVMELQAKFEDALDHQEHTERLLTQRQALEMEILAQLMDIQAKFEDAEESNTELKVQLAAAREVAHTALRQPEPEPEPEPEPDDGEAGAGGYPYESERTKQAELAGAGHGRAKSAAKAMSHAMEIAEYFEGEALAVRKQLEKELVLRMVAEAELMTIGGSPVPQPPISAMMSAADAAEDFHTVGLGLAATGTDDASDITAEDVAADLAAAAVGELVVESPRGNRADT